jgi:predicted ester cyclase
LEAELVRRGALFRKGPPFTSFVVVAGAGRLITGQQPYSGLAVAQAVIASLDAIRPSDIPAASAGVRDDVARNRDLLQRYHVEVWEQGHLDRIAAFIGPGFVSHAKPARLPAGVKPSINLMAELRVGFPDLTSHQDAILADGDLVSIRWTIRGTHTGVFLGIAPTGRKLVTSGMDILRVSDGKFVEHWGGVADQLDDISLQLDSKRATAREVVR